MIYQPRHVSAAASGDSFENYNSNGALRVAELGVVL